ncbi:MULTISPECIES: efflux RND transporter permease subunit [Pseudoalteromonas]|uniref:Acriflavine resistance protein B n=1 Tax=Pseudoalteromonas amylolytica TaxID=1859457 RepID=A0A1S1MRI8_9GAMM|nr:MULTISPECIES: efflux RND transporter permease subunit [Pseudoalteromonas]OHU85994.1 acriflavine resistance protein B [Pseudoalteromonas sp. JW3]OHU89396.1 acriflavine resistance protein B [Pseudoalteromonas amylolytica]
MTLFDRVMTTSLAGRLPVFILFMALVMGLLAMQFTAREEEPQIVVPMLDIRVNTPNLSGPEVARLVTEPLEKLLLQIPGVEHVYSTTDTGGTVATLRFHVGQSREQAILNTYTKLYANQHNMAQVVKDWQIQPIEVDDVPIMMLGLYSQSTERYSDFELTRFAQELSTQLQTLPNTSEVKVITGRKRQVQVQLDATALAAHQTTPLDVLMALQVSNQLQQIGSLVNGQQLIALQSGDVLRSAEQVSQLTVNVLNGQQVLLKDVAKVMDGPSEPHAYQWLAIDEKNQNLPLVTLSIAKQRGSNAVVVAEQSLALIETLKAQLLPSDIDVKVLRNYGDTANGKVNDLIASLSFAVLTVVIFVGVFLGWRPAIVVGLAVPICYGITLALDFSFGYTINRVTLFALILSLGLLVDDPITGVENISRFLSVRKNSSQAHTDGQVTAAMSEVKGALLMSTLTISVAFLPLAYITGMMGPYMAPMAFNVPVSVIASTVVAFLVTPWLAKKLLHGHPLKESQVSQKASGYSRILMPMFVKPWRAKVVLWITLGLFVVSVSLPVFRAVPLKLLPFDNKNEIQVLIELPEGSTLEQTAKLTRQVQQAVWQQQEVTAIAAYVGKPSSMDFNGMVRGYYRRQAPHLADLRLLLLDKAQRAHQSHAVVLRLREALKGFNHNGVKVKVVEVPPGPPVLSTLVAQVYAEPFVSAHTHQRAAQALMTRLSREAHVVEVDSSMADPTKLSRFIVDKGKAALSGVSTEDINQSLRIASEGLNVGLLYLPHESEPVAINLRLPYEVRNQQSNLDALQVRGQRALSKVGGEYGLESATRPMVALSELGHWQTFSAPQPIIRKDLQNVIYVTAELNGRTPAEVIADVVADENGDEREQTHWSQRSYLTSGAGLVWQLPEGTSYSFSGEGEWRITVDVFRDMGIAFMFALVAIFVILRWQTSSNALALIIMSAIPLTMIGIMPGFWLLNQFGEREIAGAPEPVLFTATAMIGMIALAGIVVRNSLILVEFINQARAQGMALKQALIQAGEVRMRPVLLTAGTTLLGNLVIILDPVFSGLALAIIFGIIASTIFSMLVVPLVYFLVFKNTEGDSYVMDK